jgi:cell division protein FtsZ
MPLAPQKRAEAEKKGWGFFGRKKAPAPDLRAEPVMPRPAPLQNSPGAIAVNAAQEQAAPPSGEDLFPEHNRDEQFEIPAFLRRQSS